MNKIKLNQRIQQLERELEEEKKKTAARSKAKADHWYDKFHHLKANISKMGLISDPAIKAISEIDDALRLSAKTPQNPNKTLLEIRNIVGNFKADPLSRLHNNQEEHEEQESRPFPDRGSLSRNINIETGFKNEKLD